MKIQLKRSSVTEGEGFAKKPSAGQMEWGELAVNYGAADPAIFMLDSANNVIRISGRETPSDSLPPENPLPGNFWFNPDEGRLYIYYKDIDSSQWIDASPDDWKPEVIPDLSIPGQQVGTLDDRYINITGDDMTGDLTLGTDKITLNSSDGNITTAGQITAAGRGTFGDFSDTAGVRVSYSGSIISRKEVSGLRLQVALSNTVNSTDYAFAINPVGSAALVNVTEWDGSIKIGGDIASDAPNIKLNAADGSITAAGGDIQLRNDASSVFERTFSVGREIKTTISAGFSDNTTGLAITDNLSDNTDQANIKLRSDGSADFAGAVASGTVSSSKSHSILNPGLVLSYRLPSGSGSNVFQGGYGSTKTSFITADGSAEFAGDIESGATDVTSESANGAKLASKGNILIQRASGATSSDIYFSGYSGTTRTVKISGDGSAVFARDIKLNKGSGLSGSTNVFEVYGANGSTVTASIQAEGGAVFSGNVNTTGTFQAKIQQLQFVNVTSTGKVWGNQTEADKTDIVFQAGYGNGGSTQKSFTVTAQGSVITAGAVQVGGNSFDSAGVEAGVTLNTASGNKILVATSSSGKALSVKTIGNTGALAYILGNGNGIFANTFFNLEADDDTKYTATTDADGNATRVYNGAVLDVKDRLTKVDTALTALKSALVSTTDHASLKAALIAALANI